MMRNSTPRVSVVIAAYNHVAFVRECIDSVHAQTFTDWEIVVTDDGSHDGTADILRTLAAEDERLRLNVFPANQGACVAVNDAIARARGEYVAVLNSDDRFLPEKLESQVAFLDAHPDCGAVFALPRFIDERGQPFRDESHKDYRIFDVENRPRTDWLRHFFRHGNCLCHPSVLIRRPCYTELGGYDPRLAQLPDLDMWVRLCSRYDIHILHERLLDFRILDGERNASAARPDVLAREAWERLQVLRRYLDLDAADQVMVFQDDPDAPWGVADAAVPVRIAQAALRAGGPAHRLLALDLLYEALGNWPPGERGVPTYPEFLKLSGECDVFQRGRVSAYNALHSQFEQLKRLAAEQAAALKVAITHEQDLQVGIDQLTRLVGEQRVALESARAEVTALRSSSSWKVTAPLRLAGRFLRHLPRRGSV